MVMNRSGCLPCRTTAIASCMQVQSLLTHVVCRMLFMAGWLLDQGNKRGDPQNRQYIVIARWQDSALCKLRCDVIPLNTTSRQQTWDVMSWPCALYYFTWDLCPWPLIYGTVLWIDSLELRIALMITLHMSKHNAYVAYIS